MKNKLLGVRTELFAIIFGLLAFILVIAVGTMPQKSIDNICVMRDCGYSAEEGSSYCHYHNTNTQKKDNSSYGSSLYSDSENSSSSESSSGSYDDSNDSVDGYYTDNSDTGGYDSDDFDTDSYYSGDSDIDNYYSSFDTNDYNDSYSSSYHTGSGSTYSSSSSTRDSYNSGYDDVYMDDDYDYDRYNHDIHYANGVDDALGDLEEEGE